MNRSSDARAEPLVEGFDFIVLTPPGLGDPALAIAASRAGALGVLDLQFLNAAEKAHAAVQALARQSRGRCGIKVDSQETALNHRILSDLPAGLSLAILSPTDPRHMADRVRMLRALKLTVLLEVVSEGEARAGEAAGVAGLIAK